MKSGREWSPVAEDPLDYLLPVYLYLVRKV